MAFLLETIMKFFLLLTIFTTSSVLADEPKWVLNPEDAGYPLAIVGSALPQKMGERAQYKMAELSARKEFAANKSVYIETIQKSYADNEGNTDFESRGYLNSGGLYNFSALNKVEEWKDPDSGELFLLYVLEK
jgi:hypothetical protein